MGNKVFDRAQSQTMNRVRLQTAISRHRIRSSYVIAFLFLSPLLALADVHWHKFGVPGSDKEAITVGRISVNIATRDERDAAFHEDNLVMTVRVPGQKARKYWFESTYGFGEIAIQGDLLLLKYGVGRGTFARVD